MADIEQKIINLEERYNNLHTVVSVIASKVDATNEKVDNLISEMRDRDNQRREENAEIRNSIKEIYTTTDAKITDIKNTIDTTNKHIQNFSIAAFVGVGAMVITSVIGIAAMVWSVFPKG